MLDPKGHPKWMREVEIEQASLLRGAEAASRRAQKLIKDDPAKLAPSQQIIRHYLPLLTENISRDTKKRSNQFTLSARQRLKEVAPETLALITLEGAMGSLYGTSSLLSVAHGIGSRVMDEAKVEVWLKSKHAGLFHSYAKRAEERGSSENHRRKVLLSQFNDHVLEDAPFDDWPHEEVNRVGILLIDLLCATSEDRFKVEARPLTGGDILNFKPNKYRSQPLVLTADPELRQRAAEWLNSANATRPQWMPMVIPPKPFTDDLKGSGYWTRFMPPSRLILHSSVNRTRREEYQRDAAAHQMPVVVEAVNTLGATGWAINREVLDVLAWAWDRDNRIAKLPQQEATAIPALTEEVLKDSDLFVQWKRNARDIHEFNNKRVSKTKRARELLTVATEFKDDESIYFPHHLDFRGRMYPRVATLSPQGDDLARGLLHFDTGKPIGQEGLKWLKIHLANVWGEGKASFARRIKFVEDNHAMFIACAANPRANREWSDADKPWQSLAACLEYAAATREGPGYLSRLPITVDGSSNGLQHLSALCRDHVTGPLVNLTPSDEPRDIYAHVAQRITERLLDLTMTGTVAEKTMAKHWLEYVGPDGYFPRGFAKQPVMILPYGGTHDGYKKALLSWFTKNAPDALVQDMRNRRVLINFLARQVRLTTEEAVSTSVGVMRWVKDCARAVAKTGNAVEWVAPSGFLVRQLYTSEQYKQVQIKMRGRRMRVLEVSQGEEIDVSAQSRRAPPNFIHSLDAAALVLAVESAKLRGISHIMAVHDCVGTHAADMGHLNVALREGFMRIYQRNVLMDFKAACIKAMGNTFAAAGRLEDPPRLGDLDLEQVRYAPYFFA